MLRACLLDAPQTELFPGKNPGPRRGESNAWDRLRCQTTCLVTKANGPRMRPLFPVQTPGPNLVMRIGTTPDGHPPPTHSYTLLAMLQRSEVGTTGEDDEEQRLRAALRHLQAKAGVLERLVYKHQNQHRSAAYFQYLLKVRRDLKLLLGAGFTEVLNTVFPVLACRKPANTILVPTKQTKKKPGANHSLHERLLGVARLLSQMSEPVMKAAIEMTFLLARSFFIDLCMAVFSLLARVNVLIQQMLLDVVSIYNKVNDLTDRKQAVKISISGVQAFRECYPSKNDACTVLECVWVKDKFILHEKVTDICQETQDMKSLEETNWSASQPEAALAEQPDKMIHSRDVGDSQSGRQLENESGACSVPDSLSTRDSEAETRKRVAFVAVGNPKVIGAALKTKSSEGNKKQRLDTISPSNIQSGLYNKLLDCELHRTPTFNIFGS